MDFPYFIIPAKPDGAFPARTATRRPIVPILLEKNSRRITTWALVDSGADFCLFPASIAGALDISIPNQNASPFSGTSDSPQIAYFETVRASIWNGDHSEAPIIFDLYADFCSTLEHVGLGLLGRDGFFSRFSLSFDFRSNLLRVN
ncbi:MAG: hypothetical protein WCC27_14695 [Acidobacteriaceae bacterium]